MPVVNMPDGAAVSFPDEMPAEQIKAMIAEKFPDAVKGIASPDKASFSRMATDIPGELYKGSVEPLMAANNAINPFSQAAQERRARGEPPSFLETGKALISPLTAAAGAIAAPIRAIGGNALSMGDQALRSGATVIYGNDKVPPALTLDQAKDRADQALMAMTPSRGGLRTFGPPGEPPKPPAPTRSDLGASADQGYKDYRNTGVEFDQSISGALADKIVAELKSKGAYPHLTDEVHQTVDLLRKEGGNSADEVRSVLEALNTSRTSTDKKVRRAANIATKEISQFLSRTEPEAASLLANANADYAAAARAKTIDEAGDIAGLRTGRAGYGGNAVNSMRQLLSPIVEKAIKGNAQGFNPEEISAMREIVEGNTLTNTLRGIGQLSPSKGAIQTGLAIGSGGTTAVVGAAANKLATILTRRQIAHLNDLVRKRSPAYEAAVERAADKFLMAGDDLLTNPTAGTLLKTVIAARALSAGLTRDGIPIPSGELLRRLQGPTSSAAEDDQQN